MSEKIVPIEPTQSIREVTNMVAYLYLKYQTPDERAKEDLNDKKAAWLTVVYKKPKSALTDREKRFIKEYEEQHIRFSPFWQFKQNILQFIEEQKIKILGEK